MLDSLRNAAAGITGNTVQAVITIYDERPVRKEEIDDASEVKAGKSSVLDIGRGSASGKIAAFTSGISGKILESGSFTDFLTTSAQDEYIAHLSENSAVKRIKVQFNPATITIQGQGGGMAQVTDFGGKGTDKKQGSGQLEFRKLDVRIQANIPLIFDAVNNTDAFLQDKLLAPTSITNAAKGIASLAQVVKNTEYTVQTQVEGFMAALRDPYTRRITFAWNDIFYGGVLNNISAEYTMFSPTGKPIRAVVNLGLLLNDPSIGQGEMGLWKEHYNDLFGSASGKLISNTSASQKVSTILNI